MHSYIPITHLGSEKVELFLYFLLISIFPSAIFMAISYEKQQILLLL